MESDQTFTTNGVWGTDERVKFWGQGPNALFGLVVVTCWRRHHSRWNLSHHLAWHMRVVIAHWGFLQNAVHMLQWVSVCIAGVPDYHQNKGVVICVTWLHNHC